MGQAQIGCRSQRAGHRGESRSAAPHVRPAGQGSQAGMGWTVEFWHAGFLWGVRVGSTERVGSTGCSRRHEDDPGSTSWAAAGRRAAAVLDAELAPQAWTGTAASAGFASSAGAAAVTAAGADSVAVAAAAAAGADSAASAAGVAAGADSVAAGAVVVAVGLLPSACGAGEVARGCRAGSGGEAGRLRGRSKNCRAAAPALLSPGLGIPPFHLGRQTGHAPAPAAGAWLALFTEALRPSLSPERADSTCTVVPQRRRLEVRHRFERAEGPGNGGKCSIEQ